MHNDEYDDDPDADFVADSGDDMENGSRGRRRGPPAERTRRSTRTAVLNANNKREPSEDPWADWRGERRSTRLGAPVQTQFDDDGASARKRARTDDSSMSTHSMDVDEDGNAASSSTNGKSLSGVRVSISS